MISLVLFTSFSCWWEEVEDGREDGSQQGGAWWAAGCLHRSLQFTVGLHGFTVTCHRLCGGNKTNAHTITTPTQNIWEVEPLLVSVIPLFGLFRQTLGTALLERPLVCGDDVIKALSALQSIRLLLAGMSCSTWRKPHSHTFTIANCSHYFCCFLAQSLISSENLSLIVMTYALAVDTTAHTTSLNIEYLSLITPQWGTFQIIKL